MILTMQGAHCSVWTIHTTTATTISQPSYSSWKAETPVKNKEAKLHCSHAFAVDSKCRLQTDWGENTRVQRCYLHCLHTIGSTYPVRTMHKISLCYLLIQVLNITCKWQLHHTFSHIHCNCILFILLNIMTNVYSMQLRGGKNGSLANHSQKLSHKVVYRHIKGVVIRNGDFITNLLQSLRVKEFFKIGYIWQKLMARVKCFLTHGGQGPIFAWCSTHEPAKFSTV